MDFFIHNLSIQLQQLDYALLVKIINPIILYYISDTSIKSYRLHKDSKFKNNTTVMLPPDIIRKHSEIDKEKLLKQKFNDSIINFASVIIEKIPNDNLALFYNNLNSLTINIQNFKYKNFFRGKGTQGYYIPKSNKIVLQENNYSLTIDHELLHMSSSYYDVSSETYFIGFSQCKNGKDIGEGINEGYTQLLSKRYFGESKKILDAYSLETSIAKKLEFIVGREKMESLYFNADLYNLVQELKQYDEEVNIIKFLTEVDFLNKYLKTKYKLPMDNNIISSKIKSVNLFLLKCYLKKVNTEIKDNKIGNDALLDNLQEFLQMLELSVIANKTRYNVLTEKEIIEIVTNHVYGVKITERDTQKPITR